MLKDYYIVLGVSRGADLKKIKKAYRMILKKYHPDTASDMQSTEKLLEIKEAYHTLADEEARRDYDEKLQRQESNIQIQSPPEFIRQKASIRDMDLFKSDTDEFFEGFIAGFFPNYFSKQREKDKDLYLEVILTPLEAEEGSLIPLKVPVPEPCPRCRQAQYMDNLFCPVCYGSGSIKTEREFLLSIPQGVEHGTKLRLPMRDIGLHNVYLNIDVTVEQSYISHLW